MPKQMHLALDVSWTQVESAWRMPGSWVGRHYPDVGFFEDIARIAERGLFDMIFFGDGSGIPYTREGGIDAAVRRGVAWPRLLSRAPMRLSGEPGAAFSTAIFSSRLTAADLDANADALPAPAITPGIGPRRIGDMTNVRRFNRRRGWLVLAARVGGRTP